MSKGRAAAPSRSRSPFALRGNAAEREPCSECVGYKDQGPTRYHTPHHTLQSLTESWQCRVGWVEQGTNGLVPARRKSHRGRSAQKKHTT